MHNCFLDEVANLCHSYFHVYLAVVQSMTPFVPDVQFSVCHTLTEASSNRPLMRLIKALDKGSPATAPVLYATDGATPAARDGASTGRCTDAIR